MSVDRREQVKVEQHGPHRKQKKIVADVARERISVLRRVTQGIWLVVVVLESLIAIRFLLKLVAANPNVPFARFIYSISDLFLVAFEGLTVTPAANGMVLEIFSLIAMLVYALMGWVLVQLIWLVFKPSRSRSITTYEELK